MGSTTDPRRGRTVRIDYERPGSGSTVFEQDWVARDGDCTVTLLRSAALTAPVRVDGRDVLAVGAPAVWFTFDGAMHDIGRFHDGSGTFTGLYANVITPVEERSALEWRTTDLFLDVWLGADGALRLLDEIELDEAAAADVIDRSTTAAARAEAERLLRLARAGEWPPPVVHRWTLERCLAILDDGTTNGGTV